MRPLIIPESLMAKAVTQLKAVDSSFPKVLGAGLKHTTAAFINSSKVRAEFNFFLQGFKAGPSTGSIETLTSLFRADINVFDSL
jgi:hypothetical protein